MRSATNEPIHRRRGTLSAACAIGAIVVAGVAPLPSEAGPKRQKVSESFAVKAASAVGSVTSATLVASFPLPDGVTATKGCKGKVVASAKVGGKTKTWSGKLHADGAGCSATIQAKLAKSALGKPTKLKFTFDGNKALAGFSTKKTLTIATPTPAPVSGQTPQNQTLPVGNDVTWLPQPTTPADTTPPSTTPGGPPISVNPPLYSKGKWGTDPSPEHGIQFSWTVLNDGTIPGMQTSSFKWNCGTDLTPDIWFANLRFDGGLSATIDGSVEGSYHYVSDDAKTNVTYTAKFKMTDNTVSGNMTAAGTYDYGPNGGGIKGCHTYETFTGYHIP